MAQNRLWSAQLGFSKFGKVFCPNPDVLIPAIEVDRAAAAIVRAAEGIDEKTVNLIEPNPPTRKAWLSALGLGFVPVPWVVVMLVARLTGRRTAWAARFRSLNYETERAAELLNSSSKHSFTDLITNAKRNEGSST